MDENAKGEGEKWRQYVSSLSVLGVALFIGLPLWWKTTEVYRCPLPYEDIEALGREQVPPLILYTVHLAALSSVEDEPMLVARIQDALTNHTIQFGRVATTIAYKVEPLLLGATERVQLRRSVQSPGHPPPSHLLPPSQLGHYSILVVQNEDTHNEGSKVTIGSGRWAVIHTSTDSSSAVPLAVNLLSSAFGAEGLVGVTVGVAAGRQTDRADAESMRQIRATQGYQIAITLLVPEPAETQVIWNIEEATQKVLLPFLAQPGIVDLGNFTVSSQVFHFTDLKYTPRLTESHDYYVIPSNQLPPMISAVESKLGSVVSQQPALNFLVYVTKRNHSPLRIRKPDGHVTDNFLVPQWGGMIFYSPPEFGGSISEAGKVEEGRSEGGVEIEVKVGMEDVMVIFVKQLEMLLGVPKHVVPENVTVLESSNKIITDWQVDQLLVSKMVESVSMATTTLISLVELLDQVKNMIISDHIQKLVMSSLQSVQECYQAAGSGHLNSSYHHSKSAMTSAEAAFFDPSILELLYFPDDQKFAIYIPLFLPISIPIVMSSVAALRWASSLLKGGGAKKKAD